MVEKSKQVPVRLHNLRADIPIDLEGAIESLEKNELLYYNLLSRFTSQTSNPLMQQMKKALEVSDWEQMAETAGNLRGSSGYVGAGRMHYACYYIEQAYNDNNFTRM